MLSLVLLSATSRTNSRLRLGRRSHTLAKYFISNPEFQISGYLDMQKAYEKAKETESQEKELTSVELDTLHYLRSLDEDKLKLMIKLVNEK